MTRKTGVARQLAFWFLILMGGWVVAGEARPKSPHPAQQAAPKSAPASETKPAERFAVRADSLVNSAPVNKGAWGLLVVDAATGETLYEKNADRYFTPASNMKLLTTALALDKLGPDYRFRTTLETHGSITQGILAGDLILVGRGDPNLSNRKFPFDTKEESRQAVALGGDSPSTLATPPAGKCRSGAKPQNPDIGRAAQHPFASLSDRQSETFTAWYTWLLC